MKLKVDNLDMSGESDYTAWLDAEHPPKVVRRLNAAWTMEAHLAANATSPVTVRAGARVRLLHDDGTPWFTGYAVSAPVRTFAGYDAQGAVLRLMLQGRGDEAALDHQPLPLRAPLSNRTAAAALTLLTDDTGYVMDVSGISAPGGLMHYAEPTDERWSQAAAEIAGQARASVTAQNGAVTLAAIGGTTVTLSENDNDFSPDGLAVKQTGSVINDLTVIGESEPQMYVKDYFVANGTTQRFYLSTVPFLRPSAVVVDEEYSGSALDAKWWTVAGRASAVTVSAGKLSIAGIDTTDASVTVAAAEAVELGGAWVLEHGAMTFPASAVGSGVLGGIYSGAIARANCLAGFAVSGSGAGQIQAFVNGAAVGTTLAMTAGHKYELRTRLFAREAYRQGQWYCSSQANGAEAYGGAAVAADVRVVLEVRDINPSDATTLEAPGTVLYDGVLANAPGCATYGLVNGGDLKVSIGYTRLMRTAEALVRSTPPFNPTFTRRVGPSAEGGECIITSGSPELYFYTPSMPANGELIEVTYRGSGKAAARVADGNAAAALACIGDTGVRGEVVHLQMPLGRTSEDCKNAALALLDDVARAGWAGTYQNWMGYLPAADIMPGEALTIDAPDWQAQLTAIVRAVELDFAALNDQIVQVKVQFANEGAEPIAVKVGKPTTSAKVTPVVSMDRNAQPAEVASLAAAEFTGITATQLSMDVGTDPANGCGVEVRSEGDFGWGVASDRNLVGRFTSRTFTLPKTNVTQDYYLRMYDGAQPPNYSRYSTLLHVDAYV